MYLGQGATVKGDIWSRMMAADKNEVAECDGAPLDLLQSQRWG
jgi:hypothetical protein